ncbi:MAG: hypothetical protein WAM97_16735, partial [Acidimicrobiales bacterium]
MNRRERRTRGLWWRLGAGVVVILSASTAAWSGQVSSPVPSRDNAIGVSSARGHGSTAGDLSTARLADQATATTGGTCPPDPTYPGSPTDETQYGVPFTADILAGTVNVGYDEDTGGPGTLPLTNMPWFPWLLHLTGLTGTVSGCVPLPGLSLTVQPSDLHINTYGDLSGPDDCSSSQNGCSVGPNSSVTFSYSGIADPEQT